MMPLLPPLRLTGATILREGELRQRSVAIVRGRIAKGPLPAVDLSGYLILPGLIDMLAEIPTPDHGCPAQRIHLAGSRAAAAGITTCWAATPFGWPGSVEDPAHSAGLLAATASSTGPVDMRPALRIEVSRSDQTGAVLQLLTHHRPPLVYFQNRHETLAAIRAGDPLRFREAAARIGLSGGRLGALLDHDAETRRTLPRHLCSLAERMDAAAILYGSLDDPRGDIRETYSMIGARIAACPTSFAAAAVGSATSSPVLLSPEDSGLARDILRAGICTAMVSRGRPDALCQHILRLCGPELAGLPRFWPLVSTNPAQIMGLADRGTLDYGRRADLAIINRATLAVEATIRAGQLVWITGGALERFRRAKAEFAALPVAAEHEKAPLRVPFAAIGGQAVQGS